MFEASRGPIREGRRVAVREEGFEPRQDVTNAVAKTGLELQLVELGDNRGEDDHDDVVSSRDVLPRKDDEGVELKEDVCVRHQKQRHDHDTLTDARVNGGAL